MAIKIFLFIYAPIALAQLGGKLITISDEKADSLLDDPEIRTAYDSCQKTLSPGADIGDCIFSNLKQSAPDKLKSLQESLSQNPSPTKNKEDAKAAKSYSTLKLIDDPFLKGVSSFMEKKLFITLYGPEQGKRKFLKALKLRKVPGSEQSAQIKAFDDLSKDLGTTSPGAKEELVFVQFDNLHDLYHGQVIKNLLAATSGYTLEADPKTCLIPFDKMKRQTIREENIRDISVFETNKSNESISKAFKAWGECAFGLKHICYLTPYTTKKDGKSKLIFNYESAKAKILSGKTSGEKCEKSPNSKDCNIYYSQQRACEVVEYLEGQRQNLIASEHIKDKLKKEAELNKNQKLISLPGVNSSKRQRAKLNDRQDLATTLSSKQFSHDSGLNAQAKSQYQQLSQDCSSDPSQCKGSLYSDEESKEIHEGMAEMAFRQRLEAESFSSGNNKESLSEYLKSRGKTDEEIESILKNPDQLKTKLQNQFEMKRLAIQNSIKEKLRLRAQTPTSPTGGITTTRPSLDTAKISSIINENLVDRPKVYEQLILYNNIMTGLITKVDSETNEATGRNLEGLKYELEHQGVGQSSVLSKSELERLNQGLEASGIIQESTDEERSSSNNISTEDLSKFIDDL